MSSLWLRRPRSPATLSAKRVRTVGESLDQDTLGTTIDGDLTLPASTRLGMAFTANSRWAVTADMRIEPWTEFESLMALSSFPLGRHAGQEQDFCGRGVPSCGRERLPCPTFGASLIVWVSMWTGHTSRLPPGRASRRRRSPPASVCRPCSAALGWTSTYRSGGAAAPPASWYRTDLSRFRLQ